MKLPIPRLLAPLLMWQMSLASSAIAADAVEEIEELLSERWYEVEIVVFERLDVLDVNSAEQLTQIRPRQWPHNLLAVRDSPGDATTDTDTPFNASEASVYCLGYPLLAEEDPPHPSFLPRQEPPAPDPQEMSRRAAERAADEAQTLLTDTPIETTTEDLTGELTTPLQIPLETTQLTLTPYLQFLADVASFENSLYETSYVWLPDLAMQAYVKAINRQSHLRPLLHRRWRAPVPARSEPLPIHLASDIDASAPATRAGFAKIEGFLSVTVGRYLHFAPTLWYHADNLGFAPIAVPAAHTLPGPEHGRYMQLRESRRLRSGDLHYLDHPKFGIVVRIDPVAIPEHLVSAWEALDDSAKQPLQ